MRELSRDGTGLAVKDVANLVMARHSYLQELVARRELINTPQSLSHVTTESALSLVPKFLPRILGWKPLAVLSEELGVHRNTVERIAKLSDKPEIIRLCRDNRLYISPEGERLVRDRSKELEQVAKLELVSDFAKRMGVPLNYVTAFFSARSLRFAEDMTGRARISEEQKILFQETRSRIDQRRRQDDRVVDGKLFRSAMRVASEQASLFAPPGSTAHASLAARFLSMTRYFADKASVSKHFGLGLYLPAETAETITSSVGLTQAARALGLPKMVVGAWRKRYHSLRPPQGHRMRQRGVTLSALVDFAESRFRDDPSLSQRENVPTFLSSFAIHQMAKKLGTSFSKVVAALPVSTHDRPLLEMRVGDLSRSTHNIVSAVVRPCVGQRAYVTPSRESLEAICSNAAVLGMSVPEFLSVAVSPKLSTRCGPDQTPPKLPAARYHVLMQLGLIDQKTFHNLPLVPARNMLELMTEWCDRNKVHLKTALSLTELSADDRNRVTCGDGEVAGRNVLSMLSLTRMSGDEARRAFPIKFANGPRYETSSTRGDVLANWGRSMSAAPLIHTQQELSILLNPKSPEGPDLKDGCLAPSLVSTLISNVAQARNVPPHKVYGFIHDLLRPYSTFPATHSDLLRAVSEGTPPLRFATIVGRCLMDLSNPQLRIHAYGTTKTKPLVGDILVHGTMHDYGTVMRLEETEGGTVAVVDMILLKRELAFRVG